MNYDQFIYKKECNEESTGIDGFCMEYQLFPHQRDLALWALRRGKAAIFADTGLGKTRMQLAWADTVSKKTGSSVLILAPLAVAEQTVAEGAHMGIKVTHAIVLSPFAGIGSEGYVSLQMGRRFLGVELKDSYYEQAVKNLESATVNNKDMFEDAA